jgi:predicted nuclease of predicted toxin-antitoxin system
MKVLIDMNLSPRWATVLAEEDIAAMHWSSVGLAKALDQEIMSFARVGGWVILTQDLDFGTILAVTHGAKPSVIQIRSEDVSPEAAAAIVILAIRQMAVELERGALVTIDPKRTRLRYLPLQLTD